MTAFDVAAAREAAKPPNHPNSVVFVDGDMLLAACDEVERLREALRAAQAFQPNRIQWFRDHGIVFHRAPLRSSPASDGEKWEQIAFSIYTDLCEVESIARAALDKTSAPGVEASSTTRGASPEGNDGEAGAEAPKTIPQGGPCDCEWESAPPHACEWCGAAAELDETEER